MGKELTEYEALCILSIDENNRSKIIEEKWKGKSLPGSDGGPTQELRKIHEEGGRRYCRLKEMYADNETLPETEVMKIVKGEF